MNLNLNLKDFFKYLSRYKWLLIIIPILCVALTFYFVRGLPKSYKSEALLATGITQQFQQTAATTGQPLDYFKISQQFGNLLQMMKSKKIITALSYKLILHDLKNPSAPFKEYPGIIKKLSEAQKKSAIEEYEKRYVANSLISVADNGAIELYDMIVASGYDEESLLKMLDINRNGESDFIKVSFVSSNPDLSAFVVNNLSNDFINYYTNLVLTGQRQSLQSLDTLLREKQSTMLQRSAELTSSAASAASQSAGAYTAQRQAEMATQRITEAEAQRSQVIRTISSIEGAINEINAKLSGSGGYIQHDVSKDNSEIINLDNQLQAANQRYVNNNFRPEDKIMVDSLQRAKLRLLAASSSRPAGNQAAIRQSLVDQKIKYENDLASAKNMLATVEQQLSALGPRPGIVAAPLAMGDRGQENLVRQADMAAKDYADIQAEYEKTSMMAKAGVRLALAEPGLPGPAEPSKNIFFLGFSGIASLTLCLMTLLAAFMFNKTVHTPEQLAAITKQKVLGSVAYIDDEDKDLRHIWNDKSDNDHYNIYKDSLRSLRLELLDELTGDERVLGVTSINPGAGRTFIAGSISYAFAMTGKNVLLICDKDSNLMNIISNKDNNDTGDQVFESFLVKKEIQIEDRITILNRNQNRSLLEIKDAKSLVAGFKVLKETFDTIIIDVESYKDSHKAKEWLMFCDKCIAIFEAGDKISEQQLPFLKYLSAQPGFLGWVLNKSKRKAA